MSGKEATRCSDAEKVRDLEGNSPALRLHPSHDKFRLLGSHNLICSVYVIYIFFTLYVLNILCLYTIYGIIYSILYFVHIYKTMYTILYTYILYYIYI